MEVVSAEVQKKYLTAKEVRQMLDVSEYMAYKIVRDLNKELSAKGYIILKGRIPKSYLFERLGIG